jgi:hypothetical protein
MYDAKVLEVLIASPSDTPEQRAAIHDAVVRWNETEPRHFGVVLLPVMWETHTYPDLSAPAQPMINKQVVDLADIVIATFWTTLGSRTVEADSGTVEEIERARKAEKPVLLYFCDMPVAPLDNDTTTLDELRVYKERIKTEGLFSSYSSIDELREKVRKDLTRLVHDRVESGDLASTAIRSDNANGAPETEGEGAATTSALAEIRSQLRGFVTKWQSVVGSFEGDYSADTRQSLATEMEQVILSVVQHVATVAPEAPVLQELPAVAQDAHAVAATMLYLDGGRSFTQLTDGCIELVQRVSALVQQEWELAGSTTS